MFVRYFSPLCLNDWNDVIEIKYDNLYLSFVATLELHPDEIIYTNGKIVKNIPVNPGDIILTTVRQIRGFGGTTDSEIYIQRPNEISLIFGYSIAEPFADIKDTKAYEMDSYIAKRISEYYNISWNYKDKIDSAEKVKPNKILKIFLIIFWVCMILSAILKFI